MFQIQRVKFILCQKLIVWHFILVAITTIGLAVALYFSSIIIGWLCCMAPANAAQIFSNATLFGLITIDFMIMLTLLVGLCRTFENINFKKSYLITTFILVVMYAVYMPYLLIANTF